jgi:hypothetical protein
MRYEPPSGTIIVLHMPQYQQEESQTWQAGNLLASAGCATVHFTQPGSHFPATACQWHPRHGTCHCARGTPVPVVAPRSHLACSAGWGRCVQRRKPPRPERPSP